MLSMIFIYASRFPLPTFLSKWATRNTPFCVARSSCFFTGWEGTMWINNDTLW